MPLLTDKYDAKEDRKNLNHISRLHGKTKLDGNFQRWGGIDRGSGWPIKMGNDYLKSLLEGSVYNHIIVVETKEALKYATEMGDTESEMYFEQVSEEGFEYVSIDGNNSSSYIAAFVKDDDRVQPKGKRFSEYSSEEQEEIKYTEKVNVITLRRIGIVDMCNLFRRLNTNTALNNQEWRQARWSSLSDAIRELGATYRKLFKNLTFGKDEDLDKRYHEEMIAQLALKFTRSIDLKKGALDRFYETAAELEPKVLERLKSILKQIEKFEVAPLKHKFTKGQLHSLFEIVDIVIQSYDISEGKRFFDWFVELDADFRYTSKDITEENQSELSYTYWTKYNTNSENYLKTRKLLNHSFEASCEKLLEDGVLKRRRTSNDSFTFNEKRDLYVLQDGKTREGDDIKIIDLYLGGQYEADHVKSIKNGGQTTLANGELMTMEKNRSKGSKDNEPHFPHQKAPEPDKEIIMMTSEG